MKTRIYKFFALFCILLGTVSFLYAGKADKTLEAPEQAVAEIQSKGRTIVLVVDISQSIRNQLDDIIDGLCREIVDKRLQPNDYCIVVPLGDGSNSEKAKTFGVKFSSDKDQIKEYLHSIKKWMPTNLNTDLGAAMKKTFEFVNMIRDENDGSMVEPFVCFITDGEIFGSRNGEPLKYKTTDEIFSDPDMNPDLNPYDNWWYLAIENEGKDLNDIKEIAEKTNAFPERYEVLRDMSQFGVLFDGWLSKIPDSKPMDVGTIAFDKLKVDGKTLSQKKSFYTVIPTTAKKFSWKIENTYKRTPVTLNIVSINATFQNDESGEVVEFSLIPEVGNISLNPSESRETFSNARIPKLLGKGKLKLDIQTEIRSGKYSVGQEIPEYLFYLDLKTPLQILISRVKWPVILAVVAILISIIAWIIKITAPVKIKMEILTDSRSSPIKKTLKLGGSYEFGSGKAFDVPGRFENSSLGKLVRTGPSKYKLVFIDMSVFTDDDKERYKKEYKLGGQITLITKDKTKKIIKFSKVKK